MKSTFLAGRTEVLLANDYNVLATLQLNRDRSANIRGRVVDTHQKPLAGVTVSIAGYESEAKVTGVLGQFDLLAHAADGQSVQVDIFRKGLGTASEWIQAGNQPATIILDRN